MNNNSNSFKQTKSTWLAEIIAEYKFIDTIVNFLENDADTISFYEFEANHFYESAPEDLWKIQLYFEHKPDIEYLNEKLSIISKLLNHELTLFNLVEVEDKDWVDEVQKNFPAFTIGNFFIHSSFYQDKIPARKIPLLINPGRAFGTGEHETTSGCLKALSKLAGSHKFTNMLDMGCGSSILAVAMSKLWKSKVTAIDIDEQSIKVSKENIKQNNVENFVHAFVGNGYFNKHVIDNGKYDLIVANILAKPLVKFAKYAKHNIAENGYLVLSGLLEYQARYVLNSHLLMGFRLVHKYSRNNWVTMVLTA